MPAFPTQYALMYLCVDTPAIDDMPMIDPPSAACHHRRRVLDREERAGDVEIDRGAERLDVGQHDRPEVQRAARAREEHVEPAGRLGRGRDGARDVVFLRDVGDGVADLDARGRDRFSSAAAARADGPRCARRS